MRSWDVCKVANTYRKHDIIIYTLMVQWMQNVGTVHGIEE